MERHIEEPLATDGIAGLTCCFSPGSHFSTAYGALFSITPREERQR